MLQPRRQLDLAEEPLGAEHCRQLGVEDFQRDGAVVPQVLREIDDGHATAAQLTLDLIAAGQGGSQPFEEGGRLCRVQRMEPAG
jgi:hypothetical protein